MGANPVVLHARAQAGELDSIHDLSPAALGPAAPGLTAVTLATGSASATATTLTAATATTGAAGCAPKVGEREAQRDRERRGGGEAGAQWQVPAELQASADKRNARAGELGDDTPHERTPAGRGRGLCQRELVTLVQVARVGVHKLLAGRAAGRGLGAHCDALGDRERQGQPEVVVGALADQVDAPARTHRSAQAARAIASRSLAAEDSGSVSEMNVPAPCSEPARYLSLSAVRNGG